MGSRSNLFINQKRCASKAVVNYACAVLGYKRHGMKLKRAIRLYAEDKGLSIEGDSRQWLLDQYLADKIGFLTICRTASKLKVKKQASLTKQEVIDRSKSYNKYLKSKQWRDFRNKIINDRGFRCQRCKNEFETKLLQIHHITYDRIFNEKPEDVLLLCKGCHKNQHSRGC